MAWPSGPACLTQSAIICSPTFFRSAFSCGEPFSIFMPFLASCSRYQVFFSWLILLPRDSASAAAFSDVPANYWAAKEIGWAQSQGWAGGYEDGTFAPAKVLNREEMAALLERIEDYLP